MEATEFLRNIWYFAMPASALKPGEITHRQFLGEPILFGRRASGEVYAFRDVCPHRGILLSAGRAVESERGTEVECAYHGWRFGPNGRCSLIPSLVEGQEVATENIRVKSYPVEEKQGVIWVFISDGPVDGPGVGDQPDPTVSPPDLPGVTDHKPRLIFGSEFQCHVDHAVIGLMDPPHGPFVHQSWFWRTESSIHEKAKRFGPVDYGFSMLRHPPSSNSFAYKILGGAPTTEITFRLPGVRTEHIEVGPRFVLGLTAVTPIDEDRTEVTQIFYSDHPIFSLAKPLISSFGKVFLKQDQDMVEKQREGLKHEPRLMLINDSDVQAKWYFKLKRAWTKAQETGEDFVHPVKEEVTLRWRS